MFYNNRKIRDAEKAQRKAIAAAQKAARQELTRSTDAYHVPDEEPAAGKKSLHQSHDARRYRSTQLLPDIYKYAL